MVICLLFVGVLAFKCHAFSKPFSNRLGRKKRSVLMFFAYLCNSHSGICLFMTEHKARL